ncbi:MAG: CvpA family protein [Xanthomonadales bacterium]|nr:CvpA family protein [Xanthomonadales bacterium]
MGWADWVLLGTIGLSVLVGGLRGFVKEVFALAVWIAAFLVAFQFSGAVAERLADTVSLPSARTALAFGGLFLAVLLVGALATYLVGKLVESTGLSGTDRLLGGVFGAARGLMLCVLMILGAGFTPLPRDPWWQESFMIDALLPLAEWASGWLPEGALEHLDLQPELEATVAET